MGVPATMGTTLAIAHDGKVHDESRGRVVGSQKMQSTGLWTSGLLFTSPKYPLLRSRRPHNEWDRVQAWGEMTCDLKTQASPILGLGCDDPCLQTETPSR